MCHGDFCTLQQHMSYKICVLRSLTASTVVGRPWSNRLSASVGGTPASEIWVAWYRPAAKWDVSCGECIKIRSCSDVPMVRIELKLDRFLIDCNSENDYNANSLRCNVDLHSD